MQLIRATPKMVMFLDEGVVSLLCRLSLKLSAMAVPVSHGVLNCALDCFLSCVLCEKFNPRLHPKVKAVKRNPATVATLPLVHMLLIFTCVRHHVLIFQSCPRAHENFDSFSLIVIYWRTPDFSFSTHLGFLVL